MLGAQRTTLERGLPWAVAKQAGGRGNPEPCIRHPSKQEDTGTHRHLRNLLQSFDLMLGAQRTTLASGLPWAVAKQAGGRGIPMSPLLTVVRHNRFPFKMLLLNPHSDHLGHLHPT
jgi:hypothetical protein